MDNLINLIQSLPWHEISAAVIALAAVFNREKIKPSAAHKSE